MYNYEDQKNVIFTDEGQKKFLKVRDHVNHLLDTSGSFMMSKAWSPLGTFDSWEALAYVDRMVELGEITEIPYNAAGQNRVFIKS